MAGITTAMATSAKAEFLSGGHCFNATVTPSVTTSNASTSVTGASSLVGVAVGMNVTAANIAANTTVSRITSATAFTLSVAATGTNATVTITGDVFKMALIKASPAGTYDATSTNYTNITGNSDEVSGTGYSAGGLALTNVSATTSGTTAFVNFSPNPSWTSATFTTTGCMIYNSSIRNGGTSGTDTTGAGRCLGVFDFGGSQSVSAGTLSVIMPTPAAATAIIRVA